ncbi:AFR104Wp [Eremothecium gossypii ATCC 10895]|uniref:RBR-type E3 ubiquitin transferase n=1 Tax=Eremothecium gossypii (strain ATCC 10895 / CBS 109.51 / FGSC 9923 / NRRL Y-1056) TaxID=284811 RepID=Q754G6_EREGS|nr:AFR104Wp [Eremothecium gossypii ATCC 10895]AAS53475.1 AFR104Wp [Eremothecium gossypii ATCC 10895]AEY97787.1 FAFR104Wp [Eremothecium gossypii FDAG1]
MLESDLDDDTYELSYEYDDIDEFSLASDDGQGGITSGTSTTLVNDGGYEPRRLSPGACVISCNDVWPSMGMKHQASTYNATATLEYTSLTTSDISQMMIERVSHLAPILGIAETDIILLLQDYKWNEAQFIEAYMEDPAKVFESAGLRSPFEEEKDSRAYLHTQADFTCQICYTYYEVSETFSLPCCHEYCIGCYRRYVTDKLNHGCVVQCMGCDIAMTNEDIGMIVGKKASELLLLSSIKIFIQKHKHRYKWCPFSDCDYVIHVTDPHWLVELESSNSSPYVTCKNGHSFCFNCVTDMHAPCDCVLASSWLEKSQQESKALNWILQHTKECPKCETSIIRDGGCNHMKCGTCHHEFCWICEADWRLHTKDYFECNASLREMKLDKFGNGDEKLLLQQYGQYCKHFNMHEESARLDVALGKKVKTKLRTLQDKLGVSSVEAQFIFGAIEKLRDGRTALKWSFAMAYFANRSHNLYTIFRQTQVELSRAVEDLSELLQLEDPKLIMKRKQLFYNKADYVQNRKNALFRCGEELLAKNICKDSSA